MKRIVYSTVASVGFAASALLIAPSVTKADAFGYVNVKAGYSYLMASKGEFQITNSSSVVTGATDASSASAFPIGGSIGFGYSFTPSFGLRLEAEYLYRIKANFKESALISLPDYKINSRIHTQTQTFLSNLYLDYYITSSFNLYLSGGVGASLIGASVDVIDANVVNLPVDKRATFAWQAGVGMGYAFTESLALDLNVRYAGFGKIRVKKSNNPISADIPLNAVEALLGLTYRF